MAVEFRKYHSNSLNVAIHLFTTPTAVLGVSLLACKYFGADVAAGLTVAYAGALLPFLSFPVWIATAAILAAILFASTTAVFSAVGVYGCLLMVAFGYFGQDLAHWLTSEKTYQSTYQKESNFLSTLAEHTFFLLPLVLDAIPHMKQSFLSWLVPHDYVVHTDLVGDPVEALQVIRRWVFSMDLPKDRTRHEWYKKLPQGPKTAFDNVASATQMMDMLATRFPKDLYDVEVLHGMNEVYVSCETHNYNSDTVFYMDHVDGPYEVYPFCFVYRTLVAVNKNNLIRTVFPHSNFSKTLTLEDGKAGVISFDFNREMHRIEHKPGASNEEQRVVLKIHYLISPKSLTSWYGHGLGYLTVKYNETFRFLFNSTIAPKGLFWRFMATQVIAWTWIFNSIESLIGMNNFVYYLLAGVAALALRSYSVFLVLTSYLHYLMYISTYYHREKVSFGQFKRNAVVYKTVSVVQILSLYAYNMYKTQTVDYMSLVRCRSCSRLSDAIRTGVQS
eukprot:scaffold188_cov429-Prasinococcus_capsulatus_cf.AAC.21